MRDERRTHGPLAGLAERQHGVVSVRQLAKLGYSRHAVSRASISGRLHRLHRGVYAIGHDHLSWHGHCLAAVLACSPNALASHMSAAWLWDLLAKRPGTIHVTAPTRRHARPSICLHYARLAEEDRAVREGIPVTALPRTLLDLAGTLPPSRLDGVIERSDQHRLFDLREMNALLDRAGSHPGAARMRRALAIYRSEAAFTRSRLERHFLQLVERAGIPRPSMNYSVAEFELDAYWEAERFAVELDVYETHGSRRAFERDRLRQEELKLMGVEMIRITGHRLHREPDNVIERVAVFLRRRRQELNA